MLRVESSRVQSSRGKKKTEGACVFESKVVRKEKVEWRPKWMDNARRKKKKVLCLFEMRRWEWSDRREEARRKRRKGALVCFGCVCVCECVSVKSVDAKACECVNKEQRSVGLRWITMNWVDWCVCAKKEKKKKRGERRSKSRRGWCSQKKTKKKKTHSRTNTHLLDTHSHNARNAHNTSHSDTQTHKQRKVEIHRNNTNKLPSFSFSLCFCL